jgi:hypothetical protein
MKDLAIYPGQWIQCDVRNLDMEVLGKFRSVAACWTTTQIMLVAPKCVCLSLYVCMCACVRVCPCLCLCPCLSHPALLPAVS